MSWETAVPAPEGRASSNSRNGRWEMKQTSRKPVPEMVADHLSDLVIRGELKRGDRLPNEPELARLLGVARSSLRSGLQILEARKRVEVIRGRGSFITFAPEQETESARLAKIDPLDADSGDLAEVYTALSVSAAGLAARRASPDQIDHIDGMIGALEEATSSPRSDVKETLSSVVEKVVEASNNPFLTSLWRAIPSPLEEYPSAASPNPSYVQNHSPLELRRMANSLRARDAAGARLSIARYILDVLEEMQRASTNSIVGGADEWSPAQAIVALVGGRVETADVQETVLGLMSPAQIGQYLLDRVYGPSSKNSALVSALLGGAGRARDGSDLTVSEWTLLDFTLAPINRATYRLTIQSTYQFRNQVDAANFQIFITSDPKLRDRIVPSVRSPLFELWFIREDETLDLVELIDDMKKTIEVGYRYTDSRGRAFDTGTKVVGGMFREVPRAEWDRYLEFFARNRPAPDRENIDDYADTLHVLELELDRLVPPDADVDSIEDFTVSSSSRQVISDGFCYWEAPYPCYIEKFRFDISSMPPELYFSAKPFAPGSSSRSLDKSKTELTVGSWMLPGHGMVLQWRPGDKVGLPDTQPQAETLSS